VSAKLAEKIQLGLDELAVITGLMPALIARTREPELPVIETAAACTMLHSFYTEIEKILKLIALDLDRNLPSSESWHRDLLCQMAASTKMRPAVITPGLVTAPGRTAGIPAFISRCFDRADALAPLVAKVDGVYKQIAQELNQFQLFLRTGQADPQL